MDPTERQALLESLRHIAQLFRDRDDMVIGLTAALLDLYRTSFANGHDTKAAAVTRLQAQLDQLKEDSPDQSGSLYLQSLLHTLEAEQLNAAKLAREAPQGRA